MESLAHKKMEISTKLLAVLVLIASALACSFNSGDNTSNKNPTVSNSPANTAKPAEPAKSATPDTPVKTAKDAVVNCKGLKLPGKIFIANQSFPFDFEPFKGSCFATFGSKEDMLDANDVPRGSTFYIFENGESVYELPDAFGGQSSCWVDAISFKDLNNDGLMDVIMAGSCLGARDSYPSNAVFANNGRGFTTNDDANGNLGNLKSAKAIEAYVTGHLNEFF